VKFVSRGHCEEKVTKAQDTVTKRYIDVKWLVRYHCNRHAGKSFKPASSMNFRFICRGPSCLLVLRKVGLNSLIRFQISEQETGLDELLRSLPS